MAKDPVCGMDGDEKRATKMNYKGKAYYFCSPTCQWAFKENPKQFVKQHGTKSMAYSILRAFDSLGTGVVSKTKTKKRNVLGKSFNNAFWTN